MRVCMVLRVQMCQPFRRALTPSVVRGAHDGMGVKITLTADARCAALGSASVVASYSEIIEREVCREQTVAYYLH